MKNAAASRHTDRPRAAPGLGVAAEKISLFQLLFN
jgi:hypothetical protein